jgi:hypothetical protein
VTTDYAVLTIKENTCHQEHFHWNSMLKSLVWTSNQREWHRLRLKTCDRVHFVVWNGKMETGHGGLSPSWIASFFDSVGGAGFLAVHLKAQGRLISLEKWMMKCAGIRPLADLMKTPSIQLSFE